MEDLVHDLADALDVHVTNAGQDNDGPSSGMTSPRQLKRQSRKRRGRKRRCDQNALCDCGNLSSGSDSSYDGALKDYMENIKAQELLSDSASDEMVVVQRLASSLNVTSSTSNIYGESDSVTENYIHKKPHRKKKRMRRMIIDRQTNCLQNVPVQDYAPQIRRKGKLRKTKKNDNKDNSSVINLKGKFGYKVEKLINNEKNKEGSVQNIGDGNNGASCSGCPTGSMSVEDIKCESNMMDSLAADQEDSMEDLGTPTSAGTAEVESIQDSDVTMEAKDRDTEEFAEDCSGHSSSFSSSDDDNIVIFTNDEGREGDDEQSDFFYEPGAVYGVPGIIPWWEKQVHEVDSRFQNILEGSFPMLSVYSQKVVTDQARHYENGRNNLRVRGSRRKSKAKKQKKPNSFLHDVNQKLIRFLKNPHEEELLLVPMKKKTRIQVGQLASLYNLDMRNEWTTKKCSPTLIKTRNTYLVDQESVDEFLLAVASSSNGKVKHYPPFLDPKRRRKTPPPATPFQEGYVDRYSNPVPTSNVGYQMLESMGWKPGSGLGASGSGIKEPIRAFQRQKNKGLGYDKLLSK
ncbi:G patch domain-containing protein 2-like [Anneissia japonica]|uniref:G patch domain-containing protein 2-like n=1 Tax=Anneissia japonica TaxID=1529436 RepID=UPI001425A1E3|nr:G patch domain-containing protein 2-like [Anneissia japonica]